MEFGCMPFVITCFHAREKNVLINLRNPEKSSTFVRFYAFEK